MTTTAPPVPAVPATPAAPAPAAPAAPATPPPAAIAPASTDVLVLTDEQLAWVEHLRQVRADLKTIKAREEEVASYLKAVLGQRNTGIHNGKVIVTTTSHPGRDKIDSKLLKSRYPDVFAAVASRGDGYRTLSVK